MLMGAFIIFLRLRFNRYIVECKLEPDRAPVSSLGVLIDT